DLQWPQALEITDRLGELARSLGRTLQVKLSNTLVVRNHRPFFPASEAVMYLSGEPLHVLTLNLAERFRRARPEVPISFSAGVDARNFADCAALGFTPITTCTDLLRPGGYGRLPAYLDRLEERMRGLGVARLGDYVVKSCGQGEAAIREVVEPPPLRAALVTALAGARTDLAAVLEAHGQGALYGRLVAAAARLNTPVVVARATADPRYRAEANAGRPRKIGRRLVLFDCINCDKCVPVCPNDANFVYQTRPVRAEFPRYVVHGGAAAAESVGVFEVVKEHQIANFQDFCNECGNCDTFCPEDGGPYIEKPRFFGSLEAFAARRDRDGFYCRRDGERDAVWARIGGREYRLDLHRAADRGVFTDGAVSVEVRHTDRAPLAVTVAAGTPDGHRLDFSAYLNMAVALDGALDTRQANPVNMPWL
ncbi:MAG TPA: 4Fe-4S dicluster domain-containing protein, partial [Vicinamibacteria bacterium]